MKQKSFVKNNEGREKDDFYRTPAPCTLALCDELKRRGIEPQRILDVGCGDGAIGKTLRQAWPDNILHGIENNNTRASLARKAARVGMENIWPIDATNVDEHIAAKKGAIYHDVIECDYLDTSDTTRFWLNKWGHHDLIISNPPFKHALRFLELALARVRSGGHVAFLLSSQWHQETNEDTNGRKRERGRFLDKLRKPNGDEGYGVLEYEGRVDFRGNGNTDRITYTWYVFGPGFEGVHCRIPRYAPDLTEQLSMVIT